MIIGSTDVLVVLTVFELVNLFLRFFFVFEPRAPFPGAIKEL